MSAMDGFPLRDPDSGFFRACFSPPSCYPRYFAGGKALFPQRRAKAKARSSAVANSMLIRSDSRSFPVLGFDFYPHTNIRIYPWGTLRPRCMVCSLVSVYLQDQLLTCGLHSSRNAAIFVRLAFLLALSFFLLFCGADRSRRKFQPLFDASPVWL